MTYFFTAHYSDGRPVSQTLLNTAENVGFFDDLYKALIKFKKKLKNKSFNK